jgi:diguanylate cyclase (GGDEF)-like protein/excisionase family DNA binding protein
MAAPQDGNGGGLWLRLGPAARLLGVSLNTLRRWSDSGKVPCYRSAGGHRRFSRKELQEILAQQAAGTTGPPRRRTRDATKPLDLDSVETLTRRNRDLELAVKAGLEDTTQRSSDRVIHTVTRRLAKATHTPVVDIYAVDGGTLRALASFDNGRFDKEWEGTEVPLAAFPCSVRAVTARRTSVAASLDDPILTDKGRESLVKWGYESQLSTPLLGKDGVIGLLELSDYVPRDFADHLELIATLGRVAGRAIENARLFEELERRNAILHELVVVATLATTAKDVEDLLHTVAKSLVTSLGFADCDIFTLRGDTLWSRVSCDREGFDETAVGHTLPVDSYPSSKKAMATRAPVVVSDLGAPEANVAERRLFEKFGYRAVVTIPLVVEDRVHGTIDLYADRPTDFAEYIDFFKTAAQIVAGALHKDLLLARLEERNRDLGLLVDSGREFAASPALADVLQSVAGRLRTAAEADDCEVYALDNDELVTLASVTRAGPDSTTIDTRYPVAEATAAQHAIDARRPVAIHDLETHPGLSDLERDGWRRWGYASGLWLPLVGHGEVIGLIALYDRSSRRFEELDLLNGLALTAASAIANATLLEQSEQRATALHELVTIGALVTAADDVDHLMRAVAQRLRDALDLACCDIFTLSGEELTCRVSCERGGFDETVVGDTLTVDHFPHTRRAIDRQETLVVPDLRELAASDDERAVVTNWDYVSEVCVPLVVEDHVHGLIDLFDDRPRDFSEHLDFLHTVGRLVAGALNKTLLVEQLGEGNRQLGLLVESGLEFGSTLELDQVLLSVAERMRSLADSDACEIYHLQGEELVSLMSVGRDGVSHKDIGDRYPVSGHTAAEVAVRTRQPFVITDVATDPRLTAHDRHYWESFGFSASVRCPLVVRGDVIGLVSLFDRRVRDFAHIDLLQGLAQIAAQALANARLLDQVEERASVLRELVDLGASIWDSHDLGSLGHVIARRLTESVDAYSCEIFASDGEVLRCTASYSTDDGFDDERVGMPLLPVSDYPTTIAALEKREPLIIDSPDDPRLTEVERALFDKWGFQSELCIPVVMEDRAIGFIDLFDNKPRDFAPYLDFIRTVGQMTAGAFENASLLDRLNDTNRELETLVQSGLEFGATLDLDAVLAAVASRIRTIADAPCCDIYSLDGDRVVGLVSVGPDGVDPDFSGASIAMSDLVIFPEIAATGDPVVIVDAGLDSRLSGYERREWERFGYRSSLQLPLHASGKLAGFLCVFDTRPREYEHFGLLQGLAQIAAQAVANATLFRQLDRSTRRLTTVNEASLELSSTLSLRGVLLSTAERLCDVAGTQCCDVLSLDDGRLTCLVSVNEGKVDDSYEGASVPLDAWASDKLAVTSRQTVALTGAHDPRRNAEEVRMFDGLPWESQLNVPLIANDRVIGVIELFDKRRERRFSPETIATVEAICRSAALAIDNANLFEAMQLRRRETELLNAIARRTAASLEIGDIAEATIEELRQLVEFERAAVAVAHDDGEMRVIFTTHPAVAEQKTDTPAAVFRPMIDEVRRKRVVVWDLDETSSMGKGHPAEAGMRSGASVALLRGEDLIGVLNIGTSKPRAFSSSDRRLLERVGTHLSLAINNARLYEEIKRMHLGNLKALSQALNAKDYYTLGHATRVAAYVVLLGQELGWPDEFNEQVGEAALLHDIGKIGVSDRILSKPGGLNSKEWELMKQHPIFGADIIRPLFSEELVQGVRHHHERWDGTGYPDNLSGEEIPLVARAMCVADSYDAMSFRRPYKQAYWYAEALAEIRRCSGEQFDPQIVEAFARVLERLHAQRNQARRVATQAARRVDPEKHALLRTPADETRPEYGELVAELRSVRDANPPTRFLTTHARGENRNFIIVVDCEDDPEMHSPLGSEILADEELPEVFAGRVPDANVLFVDEWGVWVSGIAPVKAENGDVVAVVSADLPPAGTSLEGLGREVTQTFAAMLQTTAKRLTREALDAITDGLTGLYNHRYLHERLSEEIERAREQGQQLSVLFCDLDQFKMFNDRKGHSAGDAALRGVARIMETTIRHVDLAARYGGEEFALILIDTASDGAVEVAERIRRAIAESRFLTGDDASVTISIGIATFPEDADRKEGLIDRADWAMYLAKRRGRDQVMTFAAGQKTATPGQIGYSPGQTQVAVMAQMVEAKNPFADRRTEATMALAVRVAEQLGLPAAEIDEILEAAAASDIGMVGIPDSVLTKPGDLNAEQWALIREHPVTGERIFRGLGGLEHIAGVIAHHHEHFDGSGYPAGLAGDAIPLAARVVHAVVAYRAMTTERPYRRRLGPADALAEIRRNAGTQFDPRVATALEAVLEVVADPSSTPDDHARDAGAEAPA